MATMTTGKHSHTCVPQLPVRTQQHGVLRREKYLFRNHNHRHRPETEMAWRCGELHFLYLLPAILRFSRTGTLVSRRGFDPGSYHLPRLFPLERLFLLVRSCCALERTRRRRAEREPFRSPLLPFRWRLGFKHITTTTLATAPFLLLARRMQQQQQHTRIPDP